MSDVRRGFGSVFCCAFVFAAPLFCFVSWRPLARLLLSRVFSLVAASRYGGKSRRWARQSQERRARFELAAELEKERLLTAEEEVERQIRIIWRRRTRDRTNRAQLLRRRTDERGTQMRDKAFAAQTDGRDITR